MANVDRDGAISVVGLHAAFEEMGISRDVKRYVLTREWTISETPPIKSDAQCGIYKRRRDMFACPDPDSDFGAWAVWFKTPEGIQASALDARIIEWLQGRRGPGQREVLKNSSADCTFR
jgi:hypothetical protein